MRRSFLRLVVTSVGAAFVAGFVALVVYGQSQSWTTEEARRDGVFLVYELLDREPASARAERLRALRPHFTIAYELVPRDEVERRIGRPLAPGLGHLFEGSFRRTWYFLAFHDGRSALAAGPVHPAIPQGAKPIGVVLAALGVPLIAGLIALRVQRELGKIERASQSLAVGQLGARVDNRDGPSSELAASFNAMAERVERLIRRRDELVQAVSHELGSPLTRLRFHIENLLRNAVQHARERVRVELHEHAGEARVEIHDDGPGIPEALRDKVVLPFFRSESDRARKTGGVGLGLAIVHRILEQHQGELTVDASPSLGGALMRTRWPKRPSR